MKHPLNYITALPDFLEMQRVSFCWFITQGLNEELMMFSRIHDFSYNTEYLLFGQEYSLIKPVYTIVRAKKLASNYSVQLVIPLEVRNKKLNSVRHFGQFPIINLPLMTTSATFVINGCERVIVSQIIRSPGVYFEKNRNQRKRTKFKSRLSGHPNKLGSFVPTGLPWLMPQKQPWEPWLIGNKIQSKNQKPHSIKFSPYSIQLFKLYRIITKTTDKQVKIKRINIFLNWLALNQENLSPKRYSKQKSLSSLFKYWNSLLKHLLKYQYLDQKLINSDNNLTKPWLEKLVEYSILTTQSKNLVKFETTPEQLKEYQEKIQQYQNLINLNFFDNAILIPLKTNKKKFLKLETIFRASTANENLITSIPAKSVTFAFYFSTSLKDVFKFKKSALYFESYSKIVEFKEDHPIQDDYKTKYEEKDLYTATLIPEYGSWIRFGFQKNTQINRYKYPIKNQEDEITIQVDKITQKPIIQFLKEMGLTDGEICSNLNQSDFFYFTNPQLTGSVNSQQPLLRFDLKADYYKNISEFSRIFDSKYYRIGKVGRFRMNNRLNIKLANKIHTITYEDIFAILDSLITVSISKTTSDDIDHLKNRRVRSVGELLQNLFRVGFQRLVRKLGSQINKRESGQISSFNLVGTTVREFFGSSQLSQYMDQTNPLSSLTHRRRISALGPGGLDRDRISFAMRDIHPSHYGRICPIETPEGQNVGLIASLTTCARVNKLGFLETPFWRVINGKVIKTGNPIYLTADIEDFYKIAPADVSTNENNYLTQNLIPVRYKQDFITVAPYEVDFITISPIQVVSVATSLIPFFEHDDANRALMGSNMQRQSVPLMFSQKPIVGTGLENQIAVDSSMAVNAQNSGVISSVTADYITIKEDSGRKLKYILQKYQRSNQETCINQRPIVWKGEKVKSGQILTDGPGITSSELALGQNVLVAYMPWQGYNFEDAILINERLVYEDVFTSIHIERYDIDIEQSDEISEQLTRNIPNLGFSETQNLNEDGIIELGTFVTPGDILVGKIVAKNDSEQLPEAKLLRAIFGAKARGVRDTSFRMPKGKYGRVIDRVTFNRRTNLSYKFEKIQVFVAQIRKIKVGDKIAGRHGNKGIISRILPRQDMPFLPDGTPVDVILNPLGVPSRMNVGQLYECLLGFAGHKLNRRFKILPFDEMYGPEVSRILINKKLRQASIENDEAWIFNPYSPGKMVLIDGRTGKEFENPITVGSAYMLKLIHLVDDKMHARATGPYSLITQQPLGGKAQQGGQRFGEMEVWALEGFGAAFTLKELLTIKSDDMQGRNETLNAIVKGQVIPKSGVPESFKVLLQELRSIGLDMSTYRIEEYSLVNKYEIEVDLIETYDSLSKTFPPTSNVSEISF